MALFERTKARLENWARWLTESTGDGVGYPRRAAFMVSVTDGARSDMVPVNDLDARKVHDVVMALKAIKVGAWLAIMCSYVGDPDAPQRKRRPMTQSELAVKLGCTDRTVRNRITEALEHVESALSER